MSVVQAQKAPEDTQASLFDRLGGTEGITSIVDDAVAAHSINPVIKARFLPYDEQPERLALIKQHFVEFLSAGTGGTAQYTGRDMETTHTGMNVSPEEFMALVDDFMMVLDKHKVTEQTKKDMLFISWSLKGMIIGK
ncbi:MAG: group 1 truncated hemoglobin [Bacteroidetes bacterium]|nr:MAG: group 1 truncated hemoglobin [Bacteroidota bacterium]